MRLLSEMWCAWRPWLILLLIIAATLTVGHITYRIVDDDCRRRGGHIETVYAGRGGWVCDGARH